MPTDSSVTIPQHSLDSHNDVASFPAFSVGSCSLPGVVIFILFVLQYFTYEM